MNYTGNWSITELYNLPVGLRQWFVEKTLKQEAEQKAVENAQAKSQRR